MARINVDNEGHIEEPCLSCEKAYVEDIWFEWCCDEKKCPYHAEDKAESEEEA